MLPLCTVPTVPTVLTSELVERAGARPEGGEGGGGAVAVSPGAIKRAMVSRGWADAQRRGAAVGFWAFSLFF